MNTYSAQGSDMLSRLEQAVLMLGHLRAEIDVKRSIFCALQANMLASFEPHKPINPMLWDDDRLFVSIDMAWSYAQLRLARTLTGRLSVLAEQAGGVFTDLFGNRTVINIDAEDCCSFLQLAEDTENTLSAIEYHHITVQWILEKAGLDMQRLLAANDSMLSRIALRQVDRP